MSLGLYALLIALVAAERVAELVVSRRNEAWSMARGGVTSSMYRWKKACCTTCHWHPMRRLV